MAESVPQPETVPEAGVGPLSAHAELFWRAEEANATRLAARSNLVLSLVTAMLGLEAVVLGQVLRDHVAGLTWTEATVFWALTLCSMALTVLALRYTLRVTSLRPERISQASGLLELGPDLIGKPWGVSVSHAKWHVFFRVYEAAKNLQMRNVERKKVVDNAQKLVFFAATGILLSILWVGLVVSFRGVGPKGNTHGPEPIQAHAASSVQPPG